MHLKKRNEDNEKLRIKTMENVKHLKVELENAIDKSIRKYVYDISYNNSNFVGKHHFDSKASIYFKNGIEYEYIDDILNKAVQSVIDNYKDNGYELVAKINYHDSYSVRIFVDYEIAW